MGSGIYLGCAGNGDIPEAAGAPGAIPELPEQSRSSQSNASVGLLGSCAGPGISDPIGSLPAQDIPWICDL